MGNRRRDWFNECTKHGGAEQAQEFWLTLPASYEPQEFLPPSMANRHDDARWLMHQIVRKTTFRETDRRGFARLDSRILRHTMDHRAVARIIELHEAGGAITTDPHIAGVRTTGFMLGERYLDDRHTRVLVTNRRLLVNIEREHERMKEEAPKKQWRQIHWDLDRAQYAVTVAPEIDDMLLALPPTTLLSQDILVGMLKRRQLPFSVSSTGRVFNGVTSLKRTLRPGLRINGQHHAQVDIRNAQPGFLGLLIQRNCAATNSQKRCNDLYNIKGLPLRIPCLSLSRVPTLGPDFSLYQRVVGCGRLYDFLSEISGLPKSTVKTRFIVDVLAREKNYPSEVEDVVRATFPSVYDTIKDANRFDHASLIRDLQQTEAAVVIDGVCPKLLKRGCHFATIHDAVLCPADEIAAVSAAFHETFRELGCEFALSTETPETPLTASQ